jgi:hypothetical protein
VVTLEIVSSELAGAPAPFRSCWHLAVKPSILSTIMIVELQILMLPIGVILMHYAEA